MIVVIVVVMVMMVLLVSHVQVSLCLAESLMMQVMAMMAPMMMTMANVMTVTWTNRLHSSHESEAEDDGQGTSQPRHSIPDR